MSTQISQEKIQKARQLVLEYIATHSLSDKLNRAVNELCRVRPEDPWLFLGDAMHDWQRSAPIIDRLAARNGIDSQGHPSLQVYVYGRAAGNRPPKLLSTRQVLYNSFDDVSTIADSKDGLQTEQKECTNSISEIVETISPALRSMHLHEQGKIDDKLEKLATENLSINRFNLITTISILVATTAAECLNKPFYEYLNRMYSLSQERGMDRLAEEEDVDPTLPNITVNLLKCNQLPLLSITPNPNMSPVERLIAVKSIYHQCELQLKGKIHTSGQTGAVITDICNDTESAIKLVQEWIQSAGYKKEDISIGLHCYGSYSCDENFNYTLSLPSSKPMNSKEMIANYKKLVTTHSNINMIEDGLFESDTENWVELQNTLGDSVSIVGTALYHGMEGSVQTGASERQSGCVGINVQEITTISNLFQLKQIIADHGLQTYIIDDVSDGNSGFTIDLGIFANAQTIRLPPPIRGNTNTKYNRWLAISEELQTLNDNSNLQKDNQTGGDKEDKTEADGGDEALP